MVRFSIIPLAVLFLYFFFDALFFSVRGFSFAIILAFPFSYALSILFVLIILLSELAKCPDGYLFIISCFMAVCHARFNTGKIINFRILVFNCP